MAAGTRTRRARQGCRRLRLGGGSGLAIGEQRRRAQEPARHDDDDEAAGAEARATLRRRRAPDRPRGGRAAAEEKLNRRFCELRAAVPTVSRMDKASPLADAVDYIAELRRRVERLEARRGGAAGSSAAAAAAWAAGLGAGAIGRDDLVVRMVGVTPPYCA